MVVVYLRVVGHQLCFVQILFNHVTELGEKEMQNYALLFGREQIALTYYTRSFGETDPNKVSALNGLIKW